MPGWLVCRAKSALFRNLNSLLQRSCFQVLILCTGVTDTNTEAAAAKENPKVGRAAGSAAQVQQRVGDGEHLAQVRLEEQGWLCRALGVVESDTFVPGPGVWGLFCLFCQVFGALGTFLPKNRGKISVCCYNLTSLREGNPSSEEIGKGLEPKTAEPLAPLWCSVKEMFLPFC